MTIRLFAKSGRAKALSILALATATLLGTAAVAQSADELDISAETPWYEAFTLSLNEDLPPSLDQE